MKNKAKSKDKRPAQSKPKELAHLSEERYGEIVHNFSLFNLPSLPNYQSVEQFTRQIQRISALKFEGIRFATSGSSLSPFSKK